MDTISKIVIKKNNGDSICSTTGLDLDEDRSYAISLARPLQIPTLATRGTWKSILNKIR
jgi:hypothetical protein